MAEKEGKTSTNSDDVGIDLGFQNLSYTVKLKGGGKGKDDAPDSKTIICNASGVCHCSRLLAIMGPSGAGKTSLLDLLAGRKSVSDGDISLGRGPTTPQEIQRYAAYVQQDDAISPTQTAQEAVVMAALLTLPRAMPKSEKLARAAMIMKAFHLEGCANTPVGDAIGKLKGLSGGERKRCAVAMSAIREPKILFLDEPTSGLDAFKALKLVQILKDMAVNAKSTVICTIHQPSSDIFAVFDDLMLIFAGNIVYHAVAGQAVHHFAHIGYTCPQYANPADYFFMHVLSDASDSRVSELCNAWSGSAECTRSNEAVQKFFLQNEGTGLELPAPLRSPKARSSMWTQFTVLLRRGFNDLKRDKMRGKAFIGQSIVMGLILSSIWFQVGDDQTGIQDRAGVIFFITTNGIMQNVMGVLTSFSGERGAVLREQENGMYRTLPYFISRVVCDFPLKIIGPVLFGSITYWAVGFQAALDKFLTFLVVVILLALSGNSMGLFIACIMPDVSVALSIAPLVVLPLVFFSGFVLNPDSIPIYFCWVEWISPPKYAFAALAQNEFSGLKIHCTAEQLTQIVVDNKVVTICRMPSGEAYLKDLRIQEILSIGNCCIFLAIIAVFFQTLAYFGLVWITQKTMAKAQARQSRKKEVPK